MMNIKSRMIILCMVLFSMLIIEACSDQNNNKPLDSQIICTTEWKPVCGADGKTYPNKCNARNVRIAYEGECGTDPNCACPEGYRKDGEACNPLCYYSTPRCLMPSIQCRPIGCGECPQLIPPGPDFCTDGTIIAGEKNACGCYGPPRCERNAQQDISEFCISWFDGCNTCSVTDGKISGCTEKYCEVIEEPKCLDYKVPDDCISWFDGCNNCGAKGGKLTMCTMMYCENPVEPKCLEYSK